MEDIKKLKENIESLMKNYKELNSKTKYGNYWLGRVDACDEILKLIDNDEKEN